MLIIGVGGLGCPVAEFLARAGVGVLGVVDNDKVNLSNIHRQSLYDVRDLNKLKVKCVKKKLKKINPKTLVNIYNTKFNKKNGKRLIKEYDLVVDGSDNFETKFLLNDFSLKLKKFLVIGAISKFEGHIFTYNFSKKKTPCLRCFFQEDKISDDVLNCEYDGVLGTVAGTIGTIQCNEILKKILNIGNDLNGYVLIVDLLNLNFRKVKYTKIKRF